MRLREDSVNWQENPDSSHLPSGRPPDPVLIMPDDRPKTALTTALARDGLAPKTLMLLWPIEAVKDWQMTGRTG